MSETTTKRLSETSMQMVDEVDEILYRMKSGEISVQQGAIEIEAVRTKERLVRTTMQFAVAGKRIVAGSEVLPTMRLRPTAAQAEVQAARLTAEAKRAEAKRLLLEADSEDAR